MLMKTSYLIATLIFALGLGSLIVGVTNTEDVTLFGLTFHPRIGKGIGVIAMIASVIAFLTAFGSAQSSPHPERVQTDAQPPGNEHVPEEDTEAYRQTAHRA
jgi:hypothetical protein